MYDPIKEPFGTDVKRRGGKEATVEISETTAV